MPACDEIGSAALDQAKLALVLSVQRRWGAQPSGSSQLSPTVGDRSCHPRRAKSDTVFHTQCSLTASTASASGVHASNLLMLSKQALLR